MTGLDTNVLVAWIYDDLEGDLPGTPPYRISLVVLAELAWVLRTKRRRVEIAEIIALLLASKELRVASRATVEAALTDYVSGKADFADYLIAHDNSGDGCTMTLTFDRVAARHPGFRLAE